MMRMSNSGKIKIFSSHRWAYDNHRQGLHDLLRPWVKNVDFLDLSIPKAHPLNVEDDIELATEIRDRIRDCDVFLVFAGMYVNASEWVKFEIHSAFNDSCPILAVVPNGQERLARTATKFATAQTHWRSDSVRGAIWDLLPMYRKQEILQARRARAAPISAFLPQRRAPQAGGGVFNALATYSQPPPATPPTNYLADLLANPTPPQKTRSIFDILSELPTKRR
jgi:hypothetical protein